MPGPHVRSGPRSRWIAFCLQFTTRAVRARAATTGPGLSAPDYHLAVSGVALRQAVGTARVGRKLTPTAWPNGARVAVWLTFDVDNELLQRANPLPVRLAA